MLLDNTWATHVAWAASLAASAHISQKDKQGQPYILHPMRVAMAGENGPQMVLGFLHDVLEDCTPGWDSIIHAYLINAGIGDFDPEWEGDDLWRSLKAITHNPNERNRDYIARVAADPLARAVKIHDIRDNFSRIVGLPDVDAVRIAAKYRKAMEMLDFGYPTLYTRAGTAL